MKSKISGDTVPSVPIERIPALPANARERLVRQSVRTTIQLTAKGYSAIEWVAQEYDITLKEVAESISQLIEYCSNEAQDLLQAMLDSARSLEGREQERKTIVLTRGALKTLNEVSKKHGIERDNLIETAAYYLRTIAEQQKKAIHKSHESVLEDLRALQRDAQSCGHKAKEHLSGDDAVLNRVSLICLIIDNLVMAIENELESGTPVDPDDFSQA